MTFEELKEKALSLPYTPGVYIMRDQTDKVIYVGKAKKLTDENNLVFTDGTTIPVPDILALELV